MPPFKLIYPQPNHRNVTHMEQQNKPKEEAKQIEISTALAKAEGGPPATTAAKLPAHPGASQSGDRVTLSYDVAAYQAMLGRGGRQWRFIREMRAYDDSRSQWVDVDPILKEQLLEAVLMFDLDIYQKHVAPLANSQIYFEASAYEHRAQALRAANGSKTYRGYSPKELTDKCDPSVGRFVFRGTARFVDPDDPGNAQKERIFEAEGDADFFNVSKMVRDPAQTAKAVQDVLGKPLDKLTAEERGKLWGHIRRMAATRTMRETMQKCVSFNVDDVPTEKQVLVQRVVAEILGQPMSAAPRTAAPPPKARTVEVEMVADDSNAASSDQISLIRQFASSKYEPAVKFRDGFVESNGPPTQGAKILWSKPTASAFIDGMAEIQRKREEEEERTAKTAHDAQVAASVTKGKKKGKEEGKPIPADKLDEYLGDETEG